MSIKILKNLEKSIDNLRKLEYNKIVPRNLENKRRGDKVSNVTSNVSEYIKKRGINLSKLSRDTHIQYMAIYDSLANPDRNRDLRDHELLKICAFLGVNPMDFADDQQEKEVV